MFSGVHQIETGQGAQVFGFIPTTRATSATYQVEDMQKGPEDPDRFLVGALGAPIAAVIDGANIVLTDRAGPDTTDPRRLPAAGQPLTVGQHYAIEREDGQREVFHCIGKDGTSVTAEWGLSGSYPKGASIRGLRVSGTFPQQHADNDELFEDDRAIRVAWHLTIAGVGTTVTHPIRIVRAGFEQQFVGELDSWLRGTWREMTHMLGSKGEHTRTLVRSAIDVVSAKLRAKGIDPGVYLPAASGVNAMKARIVLECAMRGHKPGTIDPVSFLEDARREWAEMWSDLTQSLIHV